MQQAHLTKAIFALLFLIFAFEDLVAQEIDQQTFLVTQVDSSQNANDATKEKVGKEPNGYPDLTSNTIFFSAVLSGVGAFFGTLIGFLLRYKRNNIAEESLVTERINQAAEKLSAHYFKPRHEKIDDKWETWQEVIIDIGARHAGLLALQRLAIENKKYRLSIMDIICEYISRRSRENERFGNNDELQAEQSSGLYLLSSDVDKALYILGNLFKLCDLDEIFKRNIGFNLSNAKLPNADLRNMKFTCVDFSNADLRYSNLSNSEFVHCSFNNTNLRLVETDKKLSLKGSLLSGADFRGAKDLLNTMFHLTYGVRNGSRRTKFTEGSKFEPDYWHDAENNSQYDFKNSYKNWREKNREYLPLERYYAGKYRLFKKAKLFSLEK